jgi:hypothetical protein
MFDCLLGSLLTGQERSQQQGHDRNANSGVADIEYQKRAAQPIVEAWA